MFKIELIKALQFRIARIYQLSMLTRMVLQSKILQFYFAKQGKNLINLIVLHKGSEVHHLCDSVPLTEIDGTIGE